MAQPRRTRSAQIVGRARLDPDPVAGHTLRELTDLTVGVTPYTTAIEWVALGGSDARMSMSWPDGESAPSAGWVDSLTEDDSLAWPPCTHDEPCVTDT